LRPRERLIVALDVPTLAEAEHLVKDLLPEVSLFKIGMQLYYAYGPQVVEAVSNWGGQVFLDLKLHDIPHTVAEAVRTLTRLEVAMLTVHAAGGREMLRQAVQAAREEAALHGIRPPLLLAVTVLTSLGQGELEDLGLGPAPRELVVRWTRLALEAGLTGVVASGREAKALRLAFEHHKTLAVGLKGIQRQRTIDDTFTQTGAETYIDLMELGLLIGSGGVLSHAPRRVQAAMMMLDAFAPEGVTRLAVDSIFMMPQLGVLSTVHERAAAQVFDRDCLIHLGTAVAPVGQGREGEPCLAVTLHLPGGKVVREEVPFGEIRRVPLDVGEVAEAEIHPARGFDVGRGRGHALRTTLHGGVVGILLDCRGRPLVLPSEPARRWQKLRGWALAVDLYPSEFLKRLGG